MDNYKAPLTAARVRNFAPDIETAVQDATLRQDDWAGDVSDVGNYANWRAVADTPFTSDAAFAAEHFDYIEDPGGSDAALLGVLDGSFLGDNPFLGEDFHDGMFSIFNDDDDDDSWDFDDWDGGEHDTY